jgi:predicted short-subunit dehydrogenase-like oxidoreductase (DUF2520 family)
VSGKPQALLIVGAGKVGQTLGRMFASGTCLNPVAIVNRSVDSARDAAPFIGGEARPYGALSAVGEVKPFPVVMIATGDRFIAPAAQSLAALGMVDSSSVVFHCSGALGSEELAPCARLGAAVASIHPLTTFARPEPLAECMAGVFCVAEGDALALLSLEAAFLEIGARIVSIEAHAKALYHAGAVFASNYLLAILEAALRAEHLAGIDPLIAREMLAPLVRRSIENGLARGAAESLTGPLARGDDDVVSVQHSALLSRDPALARCYADMTAWTSAVLGRDDPLARSS